MNPSGGPKGKKISHWMIELLQLPEAEVRKIHECTDSPHGARIAAARLLKAGAFDGVRDTEVVLDRTEGSVKHKFEHEIFDHRDILSPLELKEKLSKDQGV